VKQADWPLFSQQTIIEETPFPTLISMADKFTSTLMRASEQCDPWSSTKPRRVPVRWWTEECRDAIGTRKRALSNFRRYPTEANLITLKRLRTREQRTVRQSKHHSWETFASPVSNSTPSTVVWERLRRISSIYSRKFIPALSANGATVTSQDEEADTLSFFETVQARLIMLLNSCN
jgi:hypothetical protein